MVREGIRRVKRQELPQLAAKAASSETVAPPGFRPWWWPCNPSGQTTTAARQM